MLQLACCPHPVRSGIRDLTVSEASVPEPPEHLSERAAALWREVARRPSVAAAPRPTFAAYSDSPAASRALARSAYSSARVTLPSRSVYRVSAVQPPIARGRPGRHQRSSTLALEWSPTERSNTAPRDRATSGDTPLKLGEAPSEHSGVSASASSRRSVPSSRAAASAGARLRRSIAR
jgi:hypothetical protein